MDNQDSRRQFEDWFMPREERMKYQGVLNISISIEKTRQWEIWQASRASIVVELPAKNDPADMFVSDAYDAEEVVAAIRSIGLSIKGE